MTLTTSTPPISATARATIDLRGFPILDIFIPSLARDRARRMRGRADVRATMALLHLGREPVRRQVRAIPAHGRMPAVRAVVDERDRAVEAGVLAHDVLPPARAERGRAALARRPVG